MATTRSRSRQRSAEIKRFSLSLSIISRMASTWPCGRDFCVVNRSCGETRGSSRSTRRKVSILSGGQSERLATERLRVFWPSRQASRRRTAGGELRLGTTSMYMGALDHNNYTLSSINLIKYMGAYWRSRDGTMHTFPTVYPRIQPLLLLELRLRVFLSTLGRKPVHSRWRAGSSLVRCHIRCGGDCRPRSCGHCRKCSPGNLPARSLLIPPPSWTDSRSGPSASRGRSVHRRRGPCRSTSFLAAPRRSAHSRYECALFRCCPPA